MSAWSTTMRLKAGALTVERIANGFLLGEIANGVREKTFYPDTPSLTAAIDTALMPPMSIAAGAINQVESGRGVNRGRKSQ